MEEKRPPLVYCLKTADVAFFKPRPGCIDDDDVAHLSLIVYVVLLLDHLPRLAAVLKQRVRLPIALKGTCDPLRTSQP